MRARDRLRFFFVPPASLAAATFTFPEEEREHLARVLRLGTGDLVTAVDGAGNGARVRLRAVKGEVQGEVVERFRSAAEPAFRLTLAVGLVKGGEMDEMVERAAELGVAAFLPLVCERSVGGGAGVRGSGRLERWRRLAISGMKVAGGAVAMEILEPLPARDLSSLLREKRCAILLKRGAPPLRPERAGGDGIALIGPEGGFTEGEEEVFLRAGAVPASLGPRNLRTGTASAVVSSLLLSGGTGGAPPAGP